MQFGRADGRLSGSIGGLRHWPGADLRKGRRLGPVSVHHHSRPSVLGAQQRRDADAGDVPDLPVPRRSRGLGHGSPGGGAGRLRRHALARRKRNRRK